MKWCGRLLLVVSGVLLSTENYGCLVIPIVVLWVIVYKAIKKRQEKYLVHPEIGFRNHAPPYE